MPIRIILFYHQALAVLAFVHADQKDAAQNILDGLADLQSPGGSWAFQYQPGTQRVEAVGDSVSPAGAIAWVAMATEAFQIRYGTHSVKYKKMLSKTSNYLRFQRVDVSWKGVSSRPVSFSPTRSQVVSFEHNLDAYAAFANAPSDARDAKANAEAAASIHAFLESMWNEKRFYAGFDLENGEPNREELFLDTQSWGLLALGPSGSQGQDFRQGIQTNCAEFQAAQSTPGFIFYRPASGRSLASVPPVWTEGSLGMMLAMKIADISSCGTKKMKDYEVSMDQVTQPDGGVPYAIGKHRILISAMLQASLALHGSISSEPDLIRIV